MDWNIEQCGHDQDTSNYPLSDGCRDAESVMSLSRTSYFWTIMSNMNGITPIC